MSAALETLESRRIVHGDEDRQRWLAERRKGICSSDAPAVLGLVKWGNPLTVYADKAGLKEDEEQNEMFRWGRLMEPVILREFALERGMQWAVDGWLYRGDEPTKLATLDGWVDSVVTEVKTAPHRADQWEDGKAPAHVFAQVQHQMHVLGVREAYVAALLGGYKLRWCEVAFDERFTSDVMLPAEDDLLRRLRNGDPPPPDASEATRKALALLYPEDDGRTISLPGELIDLDAERLELAGQISELERLKDEIDNRFRFEIGSASEAVLPNGVKYTLRTTNRDAYMCRATSYRTLRRSKEKR